MGVSMKKFQMICLLMVTLFLPSLNLFSQNHVLGNFAPTQLDTYKDKLLMLGFDWNNKGLLSIFIKNTNDTSFSLTNITKDINLELNVNSKVHFDNFGNIWAFGKRNLWKYSNGQWIDVPTPPDLLPNRQFRDFCFDDENNLFVGVIIGFERYRETVNGTVYVVYDSVNNELLKIKTNTPTVSYEVIKKFYDKEEHFYDAIHAIAKRPDGAIVCILAETADNLMIYKNNQLSYQTIPVNPNGLNADVTSMEYDNNLNLWYSVKSAGQFYNESPSNGVHRISPSGTHTRWDSTHGLKGSLFRKHRYEPTLSVEKISINKVNNLVWGATEFGFFSIDESKPISDQLTFYTRDSLVNPKFKYYSSNVSNSSNQFEFVTIAQNGRNTFLASQMGFLEIVDKDTPSSIGNLYINLNNSIDIFPLPSSKSEVFVTINNHESITGSTLSIMDMSGRTVQLIQIESSSGYIQIPISTEDLSSGTYYAVLRSGRNVVTKQLVVVH